MNPRRFPSPVAMLGAVILLALATATHATTYNDGGTYTINGPDTDVRVYDSTEVSMTGGAVITGSNGASIGTDAIFAFDFATFTADGGSATGGNGDSFRGGAGLRVDEFSDVTISGGIFTGGSGGSVGGDGAFVSSRPGDSLMITGGSFVGGSGPSEGYGIRLNGFGGTGSISGGSFVGRYGLIMREGDFVLDVTGGTFSTTNPLLPDIALESSSVLNVYGTGLSFDGTDLTGTLLDGSPIDVRVLINDNAQLNLVNVVPTPSALGAASIAGLALLMRRRRMNR